MINIKHLISISININVNSANSLESEEFSELICEICVINKQNKTLSWKSHIKIIKVNKLIHINLVNNDKIFKINEECRYVATMIDDYNQYMIIYLLKWNNEKTLKLSEIFEDLKHFNSMTSFK